MFVYLNISLDKSHPILYNVDTWRKCHDCEEHRASLMIISLIINLVADTSYSSMSISTIGAVLPLFLLPFLLICPRGNGKIGGR